MRIDLLGFAVIFGDRQIQLISIWKICDQLMYVIKAKNENKNLFYF